MAPVDRNRTQSHHRARTTQSEQHPRSPSPSCKKDRTFKRYATTQQRQSWSCTACGHKLHPTAGTIYHKSSTSLHLWFYAIWLMTSTRCGISAKQLEREIGVTYKTAWRMMNLIRNELMTQDEDAPLEGDVEADETYVGGKAREYPKHTREYWWDRKAPVFAAVERGGRVRAQVMEHKGAGDVRPRVMNLIKANAVQRHGSHVHSHYSVNHSAKVYVDGNVHTQTIEGFFSTLKNGIRGSYHSVSRKWLQGYLNEYAWRYNHRDDDLGMFRALLLRAALA